MPYTVIDYKTEPANKKNNVHFEIAELHRSNPNEKIADMAGSPLWEGNLNVGAHFLVLAGRAPGVSKLIITINGTDALTKTIGGDQIFDLDYHFLVPFTG